jgi:hypothetical protein
MIHTRACFNVKAHMKSQMICLKMEFKLLQLALAKSSNNALWFLLISPYAPGGSNKYLGISRYIGRALDAVHRYIVLRLEPFHHGFAKNTPFGY